MNTRFVKTITTLAIVSLLAAGTVMAGNGKGAGDGSGIGQNAGGANTEANGGPANRMARLSEMLGLTEAQEDAVLEFFRVRDAERQDLQAQVQAMIQAEFGVAICTQRAANQGEFEALLAGLGLTDEQLALHEEMKATREERQENRKANRNGNGNGNGGIDCSLYEGS